MTTAPRLTSAQAAARLGVKLSTLYAYVSRGVIASARGEAGASTFDALEVEQLARARARAGRRERIEHGEPVGSGRPLMVLDSELTLLHDDRLFFRGMPAEELAAGGYEEAARLLWGASGIAPFTLPAALAGRARRLAAQLGRDARPIERLQAGVLVAGASDPYRDDLSPRRVHDAGRRIVGAMTAALGQHPDAVGATVAERMWSALADRDPDAGDVELLDLALVLGMDHDLAVSTLAARAAASARAHPYAAIAAALGAFDSSLHGDASRAAEVLVRSAMDGPAEQAISSALAMVHGIPGFGHAVYRRRDPRAEALLRRMGRLPRYREPVRAAERLTAVVASRLEHPANVDLALAVLAIGAGFPPGGSQALFAVARTAGWIAHIVEEYQQAPLRLRAESRYVGTPPGSDPGLRPARDAARGRGSSTRRSS